MKLTSKEQAVYDCLLNHKIADKQTLLVEVWGIPEDLAPKMQTRSVGMTISRLRKKLPKSIQIVTRPNVGYSLQVG